MKQNRFLNKTKENKKRKEFFSTKFRIRITIENVWYVCQRRGYARV